MFNLFRYLTVGIAKDLLYRWRREYHLSNGKPAFPGNGREALTEEQKLIRDLEKELRETQMERDILKKAMAMRLLNRLFIH